MAEALSESEPPCKIDDFILFRYEDGEGQSRFRGTVTGFSKIEGSEKEDSTYQLSVMPSGMSGIDKDVVNIPESDVIEKKQ